jgi:processive 1,2-diacylglycerol beta-glucosyltransferase
MAVMNPIPGQESRNSDYLLENGAAIKINSLAAAAHKIGSLLSDRPRLARLRASAAALGHPRAAFEIAQSALDLVQKQ